MPPSAFAAFTNCNSACCSALPRKAPPPVSGRMTLISRSAACAEVKPQTSAAATRIMRTRKRSSRFWRWRFGACSDLSLVALRHSSSHLLVRLVFFETGKHLHLLVGSAQRAPGHRLFHHALIGAE